MCGVMTVLGVGVLHVCSMQSQGCERDEKDVIQYGLCYAGFVDCNLVGPSLTCDFYGVTQTRPVYSMQVQL